jgi:hypothetical protein
MFSLIEFAHEKAEPRRMGDPRDNQMPDENSAIEREVRQARKFTAQEAIGRLAGAGAMKGASAVPRQQQAENEIAGWLRDHIADSAGMLGTVLNRQLASSELLLNNLDRPLVALKVHCARILGSAQLLDELARQVDVEWGHQMDERPYFERAGLPAHPDDPYTRESVRIHLSELMRHLAPVAHSAGGAAARA